MRRERQSIALQKNTVAQTLEKSVIIRSKIAELMINVSDELVPDTILRGRYKVERTVGGGNMGVVYKAVDMQLEDRPVAIKEMRWPDARNGALDIKNAIHLFRREAAILSGLNHPNLPHVYATFQEQGKYYLVMDFIEGETLLEKMRSNWGQPLNVRDIVNYAIQLCDILDYLHNQHPQVIFRDLKPSNVIIDPDGRVFLIDFGIARHFNPTKVGDTIVIGTPGYSDPEISQMNQANPLSDLYSLGATLHHCLVARIPKYENQAFQFPSVSNFNRNVPPRLDQLVLQLVEPHSVNRPASARAVKQELVQLQGAFQGLGASSTISLVDPNVQTEPDPYNSLTVPVIPPTEFLKTLSLSVERFLHGFGVSISPVLGKLWQVARFSGSLLWKLLFLLFSLLFVAGRLAFGLLLSPVTHRRAGDLWQQAQHSGQVVFQQSQQGGKVVMQQARQVMLNVQQIIANRSWAWLSYSPIWRPRFLALLGSLLVLMIAASVYILQVFHGTLYLVDLFLSLLLLFIVFIIRHMMSELIPRRILTVSGLFVLAFLLTQVLLHVVGQPVQQSSTPLPAQPLTVGSLLTWVLLASALLMLVSGFITSISQINQRPLRWRGWIDRFALFALVSTWTLLQYFFGSTEQLPLTGISSHPLATIITLGQNGQGIPMVTVNQLLCLPLAFIGLILLLRTKERLTAGDRRWLLVAMIPYLVLQWNYGANEILHFFPSFGQETAVGINVLFFLASLGAIFVMQRSEHEQFDLADRIALLMLMVVSAALQIELNRGDVHTPLAIHLPALTFSLVLTIIFIIVGLRLVFSLGRDMSGIDRVLLSAFTVACATMEFAYGQAGGQSTARFSSSVNSTQMNGLALADLHRFLAVLLVLIVFIAVTLAILRKVRTTSPQPDRLAYSLGVVDRLMTFGTALVSFLLLLAFTGQNLLLPNLTHLDVLISQMTTHDPSSYLLVVFYLLLALLLSIFVLIAFVRLFRATPIERKDRLIFLAADLACVLLVLGNKDVKTLPLLSESTQQVFSNTVLVNIINFVAQLSIVGAALVSLFWLRRPFTTIDRLVLCVIFTGSAVFALLEPVHSQLFLALLMLVLGTLIATQIERVRVGTRII